MGCKKDTLWHVQLGQTQISLHSLIRDFLYKILRKPNKTCQRDRIPCLTAPCQSHKKNFNVKLLANADTNADADTGGSTIALPGLRPGELKSVH